MCAMDWWSQMHQGAMHSCTDDAQEDDEKEQEKEEEEAEST
jgi:hypothetical protein